MKELVTCIRCLDATGKIHFLCSLLVSTDCNQIWLYFVYNNYYLTIPWNTFKAVDNLLECQLYGVVEFCQRMEKIEGVTCSFMNDSSSIHIIMKLFAHAETSLERSTRVGWTEACYAREEFGCHRLVTCFILPV